MDIQLADIACSTEQLPIAIKLRFDQYSHTINDDTIVGCAQLKLNIASFIILGYLLFALLWCFRNTIKTTLAEKTGCVSVSLYWCLDLLQCDWCNSFMVTMGLFTFDLHVPLNHSFDMSICVLWKSILQVVLIWSIV